MSYYFFFEVFLAAFLAGFLAAFFLAIVHYLLLLKIWTRIGSIGLAGSMWGLDVVRTFPTRTSSVTPRASPRTLIDKDSETLAACRNGPLSRVGSVASVVATTSRIAIQVVVILDEPHSRQPFAKIFFREGCGNFCGVRRDDDHQ